MLAYRRIPPFIASRIKSVLPKATNIDLRTGLPHRARPSTTSAFHIVQSLWSSDAEPSTFANARTSEQAGVVEPIADVEATWANKVPPEPSVDDFQQGLRIALQHNQYLVADILLQQLTTIYHGDSASRFTIFHEVLGRSDLDQFNAATVKAILKLFKTSPYELKHLAAAPLIRLLNDDIDTEVQNLAFECLEGHLTALQVPSGVDLLEFEPSKSIPATFSLLQKLVVHNPHKALHLFDILIETGNVPPEALPSEDVIEEADVRYVVSSSLIKASLHWDWYLLASRFMSGLLDPKAKANPLVPALAAETLAAILDSPVQRDPAAYLEAALNIIKQVHSIQPIPDNLIHQFYDLAARYRQGTAAEKMYAFAIERNTTDQQYSYLSPSGFALGWFMKYLSESSKRVHLLRALAEEVVARNIHLPTPIRARFIAITASTGNASFARALWERYSQDIDARTVVGNPMLLVPMVRLYSNLIRFKTKKLVDLEDEPFSPDVNPFVWDSIREPGILRARISDMEEFMNHIITEFQNVHKPISDAPHHILTTYVQACFTAGKKRHQEGFALMNTLLERNEVPDIYDINVCLNGVARNHPRRAADLLRSMVKRKKLKPDATSYGTIMSQALVHRDYDLVNDMIGELRRLPVEKFTLKSVTGLLSAVSVERPTDTPKERINRLRQALSIVETWMASNRASSPQVGRDLVNASLKLGDASLAYRFWGLMISNSWEWDDHEHWSMRRSIKQLIETHTGTFTTEERDRMFAELKV